MRRYGKRIWQWIGTSEGKKFIGLVGLALLVRLVLAPFFGFYLDIQDYVNWGMLFDQHPLGFYALAGTGSAYDVPNYPPLMIYLCGILTGSYFGLAHLLGISATSVAGQAPLLVAWMKLPAIVCDLGAVVVLYALARRVFSERAALLMSASYAFSPAILGDGAFWGQTDGIALLFLLLALLCVLRYAGVWAGICFGLAIMLKLQSFIFAPLLLLSLWRWAGWKQAARAVGSMALVVLVICSPYLLSPASGILAFYRNVQIWANANTASNNAFNLWFILGAKQSSARPYFAFFSPSSIGLLLFGAALLLALYGVWRDRAPQTLFLGAALVSVAFFVVTTLQHERYLYPALALALAAALSAKRNWFYYVVPSITLSLNLLLVLIINVPTEFGLSSDGVNHWNDVIIGVSLALCLVNIWLLVRMIATYWLQLRAVSPAASSSPSSVPAAALLRDEEPGLSSS